MHTSTSGGRNDTEQNALAVMPCTSPLAVSTVMTVTPVAKRPRAARNSSGVTKSDMQCVSAKARRRGQYIPSRHTRGRACEEPSSQQARKNSTTDLHGFHGSILFVSCLIFFPRNKSVLIRENPWQNKPGSVPRLRSGFRLQAPVASLLTPAKQLNLQNASICDILTHRRRKSAHTVVESGCILERLSITGQNHIRKRCRCSASWARKPSCWRVAR